MWRRTSLLCIIGLALTFSAAYAQPTPSVQPVQPQAPDHAIYLPLLTTPPEMLAFSWQSTAYDQHADIAVANLDGSAFRALTHTSVGQSAYKPAWSPDGKYIAFWFHQDNRPSMYVMQSDGSDQHLLWSTSDPMYQSLVPNRSLAWSPDSTRIAFAGWRNRQPTITVLDRIRAIPRYLAVGIDPQWSPDGARLVFTSMLNNESVVSVIPADGTHRTPLAVGLNPRWSPDGAQIAYVAGPTWPAGSLPRELCLMSPDGSNQHSIFKLTTASLLPYWLPDSASMIAFADGTASILATDGTLLRQVSVPGGEPALSPNGLRMVTWTWVSVKATEVTVTELDGTGVRRVPIGLIATDPVWRP